MLFYKILLGMLKNRVLILENSIPTIETSKKVVLNRVLYINYPVWFQKKKI